MDVVNNDDDDDGISRCTLQVSSCSILVSYLAFTRISAAEMAAIVVAPFSDEKIEAQGMKRSAKQT